MFAALSALFSVGHLLRGKRVLHFIDNIGGLAALIGGASAAEDLSAIATVFQLLVVTLGVRLWLEYVESEANPSDGPSRLLKHWAKTMLCRCLGAKLVTARLPDLSALSTAPIEALRGFPYVRTLEPM